MGCACFQVWRELWSAPLFSLPLYLVGTLLAGKMIPGIQLRRPHPPKKMTMFFVTLALWTFFKQSQDAKKRGRDPSIMSRAVLWARLAGQANHSYDTRVPCAPG